MKDDNPARPIRFTLLLSRKEKAELDRKAREMHIDRSTYARLAIFGEDPAVGWVPKWYLPNRDPATQSAAAKAIQARISESFDGLFGPKSVLGQKKLSKARRGRSHG